ncbi:hypothetical protein LSH36_184g11014, partial [Paralvinella palmiformis]
MGHRYSNNNRTACKYVSMCAR